MNIWVMFGIVWGAVFGAIVGLMELRRWMRKRADRQIQELTRLRFSREAAGEGGQPAGSDWLLLKK